MQAATPLVRNLAIKDLLVEHVGERVPPGDAVSRKLGDSCHTQEPVRVDQALARSSDDIGFAPESRSDLVGAELDARDRGRFEQRLVGEGHGVKLRANHVAHIVRHVDLKRLEGHGEGPAGRSVDEPAPRQ